MTGMTLYAHAQEFLALEQLLDEAEGSDDVDVQMIISTWWAELQGKLEDKVDGTLALVRDLDALAKVRAEEAARLTERARVDAARASRIKGLVLEALETAGIKSLETRRFKATVASNGGKQPLALEVSVDELPDALVRVERKPDWEAIRAALESGVDVKGARLMPRGTHLRIK